jgi:hypothetical protein
MNEILDPNTNFNNYSGAVLYDAVKTLMRVMDRCKWGYGDTELPYTEQYNKLINISAKMLVDSRVQAETSEETRLEGAEMCTNLDRKGLEVLWEEKDKSRYRPWTQHNRRRPRP